MPKIEMLTRADLTRLSVVQKGLEQLDWELYDTLTVPNAAPPASYKFFQQSSGNLGISLEATNMEIPGQLPNGYRMVAQEIQFVPKLSGLSAAAVNDAFQVSHFGYAQFFIGNRPYWQGAIQDLLGGGFFGFTGVANSYVAPRNHTRGKLELAPVIPSNFGFNVTVQYDTAPVVAAAIKIQCKIVGKLIRPSQG